jgi:hypothetical protein
MYSKLSSAKREGRRRSVQAEITSAIVASSAASGRRSPHRFLLFVGDRLTGNRLRFTAALTVVVACLLLAFSFATTRDNRTATGLGLGSDYLAFYDAGTIANDHGVDRLYDLELQARLYHANLPGESDQVTLPYANAPFLAVMLRPFAMLPYSWSYAVWVFTSLVLFASAFVLVWKTTGLNDRYRTFALLMALSFEPFLVECLHGGQISAFGLIWISLAIYYAQRAKPIASGLALSVCIYKPTLLPLILPMLIIMRQWRTLAGFVIGTTCLAATSVATVGAQPCLDYLRLLFGYFSKSTGAGSSGLQVHKFIDLNSFLKLLGVPTIVSLAMLACVGLIVLKEVWRARPRDAQHAQRLLPLAWASVITWTLVLNVYVGVYDSVLLIPSIVLTCSALLRRTSDNGRNLPLRLRCLLLVTWLLPWVSGLLARDFGVQPFTIALLILGVYQLKLLTKRATQQAIVTRGHVAHRITDGSFASTAGSALATS